MHSIRPVAFVLASMLCVSAAFSAALPFVNPMFGDHMIIQRDKTNTIWGWAKPGETVRVEISGRTATATAAADGR